MPFVSFAVCARVLGGSRFGGFGQVISVGNWMVTFDALMW